MDDLIDRRKPLDAKQIRTEKSRTGCRCQNRRKEIYNKMTRNEEMAQMAFDGATQREIAEKYGVSKQRVAQSWCYVDTAGTHAGAAPTEGEEEN